MDGPRLLAAARELRRRREVEWRVYAVLEVLLREAGLLQDGADGGQVRLLSVVRGAGDGELLVRQTQSVESTGEDERQRLKGNGRGTSVN